MSEYQDLTGFQKTTEDKGLSIWPFCEWETEKRRQKEKGEAKISYAQCDHYTIIQGNPIGTVGILHGVNSFSSNS